MLFIRRINSNAVYVVESGQLVHVPDAKRLAAIANAPVEEAYNAVVDLPSTDPIWELPINGG